MTGQDIKSNQIITACLVILSGIATTTALMHLKNVIIPFILAVFLFFMFSPLILWLKVRLKIPQSLSVGLTLVLTVIVLLGLGTLIVNSINLLSENISLYQTRTQEIMASFNRLTQKFGITIDLEFIEQQAKAADFFRVGQSLATEILSWVGNLGLIIIYVLFMLLGTPSKTPHPVVQIIAEAVSKYIWTKLIASLATGLLVAFFLFILDVELAFMFGVLAFFLNFIPSVGSIVATILPLPLAFLQFGFGPSFWLSLALPGLVQLIIGNVLETKLQGDNLDLHPVTVLFFLVFWGAIWGVAGMFLAVPITSIIKIVLSLFPRTRFLSELLAGRISENQPLST